MKIFQGLEHHDIGATAVPHADELQADNASADNTQSLGHLGERQGAGGIHDVLVVAGRRGNLDGQGTGGDDDIFRVNGLHAAVRRGQFHLVTCQHLAGAGEGGDAVGLEQAGDAAGEPWTASPAWDSWYL